MMDKDIMAIPPDQFPDFAEAYLQHVQEVGFNNYLDGWVKMMWPDTDEEPSAPLSDS